MLSVFNAWSNITLSIYWKVLLFNYNKSYARPYSTIRSYWKSICRIVIWTRKCSRSQPVYYFYKRYFPSIICCIDKNIIEKHVFSRCWSIHNYWNTCYLTYITYLKRKWIRIGRINVCLTILSIRIYITTECKVNASIHNEFIAIQRYRIYPWIFFYWINMSSRCIIKCWK